MKNRWSKGQGALLLVTHDRWFLDEVCESMWEVHDGVIEPFEGGYSAYMLQRVERDRQADVRETKRRNLARKELWHGFPRCLVPAPPSRSSTSRPHAN